MAQHQPIRRNTPPSGSDIPDKLYFRIGEVSRLCDVPAYVLRFWESEFPQLKPHLRDEAGEIRRFLNVYVNEEDIRFLGGPGYTFQDGDEVLLVPSVAGGKI